jgi:hypothetical protein
MLPTAKFTARLYGHNTKGERLPDFPAAEHLGTHFHGVKGNEPLGPIFACSLTP